jgi:hypothetical protein
MIVVMPAALLGVGIVFFGGAFLGYFVIDNLARIPGVETFEWLGRQSDDTKAKLSLVGGGVAVGVLVWLAV